jgi:hypothetical protein
MKGGKEEQIITEDKQKTNNNIEVLNQTMSIIALNEDGHTIFFKYNIRTRHSDSHL